MLEEYRLQRSRLNLESIVKNASRRRLKTGRSGARNQQVAQVFRNGTSIQRIRMPQKQRRLEFIEKKFQFSIHPTKMVVFQKKRKLLPFVK